MADDRTYIRLHDGAPGHPKIRGLSDRAFRTWISALCFCSEYLTDGEIVTAVARDLGTKRVWMELVEAGLAEPAPKGYLMHDYLAHQRSASEVAEIKAGRGAGGSLGNHVRWHVKRRINDPGCEHCNPDPVIAPASQERSDSDSDGTSQGNRSGSHSQRQRQRATSYEEKGGYVPNASDTRPPTYSDRCSRHAHVAEPGPCGNCADARKANTNATRAPLQLVPSPTQKCLIHLEPDATHCSGCAADRKAIS